ncbi:MAG: hypothetical protein Q9219_005610 [cf. Caloplaca sp. 3 TL-2023]
MATNRSEPSQVISEVAHAEGGTTKGSKSAQMQSELTKQRNLEETTDTVGSKLETAPESITKQDAQAMHRAEARALGGQQPGSGSMTAEAQHQAAVNQGATSTTSSTSTTADVGSTDPTLQSQMDRQANFEDAATKVGSKLTNDPDNITKEDADLLHSREHRALGHTEKGGLAAQAQHQAAENQKP